MVMVVVPGRSEGHYYKYTLSKPKTTQSQTGEKAVVTSFHFASILLRTLYLNLHCIALGYLAKILHFKIEESFLTTS